MKQRDFAFLFLGAVLGLLAGVVLVGSSDDVRTSLFGTAGLTADAEPAYFLVDMEDARALLEERFPDEREQIEGSMTGIAGIITADDFAETVRSLEGDIDFVVSRSFTALTGTVNEGTLSPEPAAIPNPLIASLTDGDVSTCLSLDENPYNVDGVSLYLYVQVPSTQVNTFPATWERLDEPKEDALYWQRLACQSLLGAQNGRPGR
jgi:hypothetical protein